jgi:hypothetical protein
LLSLNSVALVILPPVARILLGVRSARTGNHLRGLTSAIGSTWLTIIAMFIVGANYLWSGQSLVAPNMRAIVFAIIVGGEVEAAWQQFWHTPNHPGAPGAPGSPFGPCTPCRSCRPCTFQVIGVVSPFFGHAPLTFMITEPVLAL